MRGRLLLLIPLALLLIASGYLIANVPANLWKGNRGAWLSGDKRSAIFYDEVYREKPSRTEPAIKSIDLESGVVNAIDVAPAHTLSAALDKQKNVWLLQHPFDETRYKLEDSIDLVFIDFSTHQVRVTSDISFPPVNFFRLIGDRYLVAVEANQLHSLDIENLEKGVNSVGVDANSKYLMPIDQPNRFFLAQEIATPVPLTGNPVAATLELFEIDDQGRPQMMARWPAGVSSGWTCCTNSKEQIFSLSADLKRIEAHSVVNGSLDSSDSLPDGIDWATGKCGFSLQTISIENNGAYRYFDLEHRKWLPPPGGKYRIYSVSPDEKYYYFYDSDEKTFKLYNRLSEEYIYEFDAPPSAEIFPLDEHLFVETSSRYGYSVRFFDAVSGKTIREIKPLGWIVNLLVTVLVLYTVWSIAWLQVSALEGGWAWVDVLLVVGIPLLFLLVRFVNWGETLDLTRLPTRDALGGVMGAEMLAVTWIVFGRTRLTLRVIPLMILTASFIALLGWVFSESTWIVWHAVQCVIAPAACVMLLLLVLRLLGWRLHQDLIKNAASEIDQRFGRTRFPLRDLVLMTVVVALLFAATRPVADAILGVFQFDSLLMKPLALAVVFGCAAPLLALNSRRSTFLIGVSLALVGIMFLAWEPISVFINGETRRRALDPHQIHAVVASGIAFFAGLVAYRLRGWTLARRPLQPVALP